MPSYRENADNGLLTANFLDIAAWIVAAVSVAIYVIGRCSALISVFEMSYGLLGTLDLCDKGLTSQMASLLIFNMTRSLARLSAYTSEGYGCITENLECQSRRTWRDDRLTLELAMRSA